MGFTIFTICYIFASIILKIAKENKAEFWTIGRHHCKPKDSYDVLVKKQIAWQIEVLEALYQNDFKRIGYFFPYKKAIEDGVIKLYGFMEADDVETRELIYHFLKPVAATSCNLEYLKNWERQGGLVAVFMAIRYWKNKGKIIRPQSAWKIGDEDYNIYEFALSFANHLFAKYPTPPIINKIWACWEQQMVVDFCKKNACSNSAHVTTEIPENALFDLYFYLADGGSLRMNNILKWYFSKKVAHYFSTEVPRHMGWEGAYWYAIARAEGLSSQQTEMLWEAFNIFKIEDFKFWRILLQQIANTPARILEKIDIDAAIETVMLIKFGYNIHETDSIEFNFANREPEFTWKTRKLEHSVAYLKRCYTIQYAIPKGFEDSYTIVDKVGDCWHFTLLRNRHELFKEGKSMAHCVGDGDYHQDGVKGVSSFWSLQKRPVKGTLQRCLTIEVCHEENFVRTALGYENRDAAPTEMVILEEWCRLVKLKTPELELAE